ncbi:hypothetical protein L873DRAFT_1794522 [Choiromyces venosus 120613-1]|uniref:Uncharacterized protein n=1 Tax=Choiromyces venosus 120613-1 TaxID=1336337 RepID=A0A3N4J4N2_9PEZI|nr:hypothetical protein L873DRAFT_1794522 [Choiromyces venosus 120613-1]
MKISIIYRYQNQRRRSLISSIRTVNPTPADRQELGPAKPRPGRAAENGNTEVVKLLLSREDVELDASDFRARTPLFIPVLNYHEAVVRVLLSRHDIYLNSLDSSRETPLSVLLTRGQVAVVNLLLGRRDIILDRLGRVGSSAIDLATWCGHEEMLRILPAREDTDPNSQN